MADNTSHADEYRLDYSKARPNRFAAQLPRTKRVVVLDPDVAAISVAETDKEADKSKRRSVMGSVKRRHSKEEIARRGDAIYEKDVSPLLGPRDKGKFAAIDIESGMYEVHADEMAAGTKLRARIPEAQIWMVRIGFRSVQRIGGRAEGLENQ